MDDLVRIFDENLILVISADRNRSSVLNTQLKQAGLKPIFVSSPDKGLSILRHARECSMPFILTLFDFELNDQNGIDYLGQIRMDPLVRDSNIILLTSEKLSFLANTLTRCQITHILQWPFQFSDLTGVIAEYIPLNVRAEQNVEEIVQSEQNNSYRILCADDNAINLAVLKGFLNIAGYSPDTVSDGSQAVKAYKNVNYDLILMDIMMPVMDGVVATLQIREVEHQLSRQAVPIVAITAHYTPSQRDRYIEAGMNDVISKPISKKVIDDCLAKWCPRYIDPETNPGISPTGTFG